VVGLCGGEHSRDGLCGDVVQLLYNSTHESLITKAKAVPLHTTKAFGGEEV
jgi:hypothetical protein